MRKWILVGMVSALSVYALGFAGQARASVVDRAEARELMERIERHGDALYELSEATLKGLDRWPPSGSAYELWIMVEAVERRGDRLERRYRDTRDYSGAAVALEALGRELERLDELAPLVLPPGRALERVGMLAGDLLRLERVLEDELASLRDSRPATRDPDLNVRDRRRVGDALRGLYRVVDRVLPLMPDPPEAPALPDSVGDGTSEMLVDPADSEDALRQDDSDLFVEPSDAAYVRRGVGAVYDELRIWLVLSLRLADSELSTLDDETLRERAARVLRVGRYVDRAVRRFEGELSREMVAAWNDAREPQLRLARVLGLPEPRL